jgi:acyl dehydratase
VGRDGVALGVRRVSAFADLVGVELGPTAWREVSQTRIDAFAAATDDSQWIHTDPERASEGPFGTTIAHGFLTLSLCVPMLYELLPPAGSMVVNYGVDRVRFPAAVPSGARIRGRFSVASAEDTAQGERAVIEATVECEGVAKPVCVAQLVVLRVP